MAGKSPTAFHRNWPNVSDPTELPNVSGATIQDAGVEVGDQSFSVSDDTTYQCTTATIGSAVWTAMGGGSAASVHFQVNGPLAAISPPTNFEDGLKELGVTGDISSIILSQEIDGSGGSTTVELYKIDPAGAETLITVASSLTLAAGGGANARVLSTSFNPATTGILATDRLGIKVTAIQAGVAADVSVSVILGGTAFVPVGLPEDDEVTQAVNATVLGTTYDLVGSVYLPVGTILAASSHLMMGTDQVADTATLELRRFTGGTVLGTIPATGVLQDVQPGGNIVVANEDWYDLYLKSDVITTNAILRGLKLVYAAGNGTRIRNAFSEDQTGTTPLLVGSVYLPFGALQALSRSMLGTTAGGTATLELRRFTGGTVVATWQATGALQDVQLGAPVNLPATDWYDIYIYGDAGPTVAVVKGLDWTVLT